MKKLICLSVISAILLSSCGGSSESYSSISERSLECFKVIPDHNSIMASAQDYMTDDLYQAIKTAWDVPDFGEYIGEIGDNEFLFYFVSGQDDGPDYESAKVSDIVIDGKNRCNAEIEYNLGEGCYAEPTKIGLSLIKSNGKWRMDDFSREYMESAKETCLSYIKDQKKSYKTGEIEHMIKEAAEEWLGWNDYELNSALDSLKADWDRFYKKYPKEK